MIVSLEKKMKDSTTTKITTGTNKKITARLQD
jgi:hypothetical protein